MAARRWELWYSVVAAAPATAVAAAQNQPAGLAVFTLVRGGTSDTMFETFINSRHCLHEAMPSWLAYDNVVFHEGNVATDMQLMLQLKV